MRTKLWIFVFSVLAACGGDGSEQPGLMTPRYDAGMDPASTSGDAGESTDATSVGASDSGAGQGGDGDRLDASLEDAGSELEVGNDAEAGNDPDASAAGDASTSGQDAGPELTDDEKLAKALDERLRECDVVGGTGQFNVGKVEDELDRCIARCAIEAECADLQGALCAADENASPYGSCSGACVKTFLDNIGSYPSDGFLCRTGDVIPHMYVCDDGKALDCNAFRAIKLAVSEDEVDCPKFTCKSGSPARISEKFVCDGLTGTENGGCSDGSDEANCASFCGD